MPSVFVGLPVIDLDRATQFYTAVGFAKNPMFSDHNGVCFTIDEDHNYLMTMTREFFQSMTPLPIGDNAVSPSVSVTVFVDSREEVDSRATAGLAAGGHEPEPPTDYGFMYTRQVNDPDGNVIQFGWADPNQS
ncbi:VOC family protein [Demequina sp.]|uniref:VOC family protein n=1 Tax=Demequina sp. TaxID=2050685 RepID=UPI003D10C5FA